MKQLSRNVLQVGTGVVAAWLVAGCATTWDLEQMDQRLTKKLDAQTRTIRMEASDLHERIKSFKSELGNLSAQVNTVTTDTKKTMDSYDTRNQERFRRIEMMTGETTRQLQAVQQTVSGFSGRIEHLPSQVTALGTEVRSLTEALMGNYELEEAAIKDRLRVVKEMKSKLRPLQAYETSGTGLEK